MSLVLVSRADRYGRRRVYVALLVAMGVAGAVFALTASFIPLLLAALTGTLSVEVTESGPFTSLEQAMLPHATPGRDATTRAFGVYNAIAALVGSAGALAAGGPELLRRVTHMAAADRRFFLLYPALAVVAAAVAWGLSDRVEAAPAVAGRASGPEALRGGLHRSREAVRRLAALQALDSFAGGFIVQSFLAFFLVRRFGASTGVLALTFSAVGLIQAASFLGATVLGRRFGLLRTMVFTHLPSNLLLVGIPLAPSLPVAVAVLLVRYPLSQMDVPARQAYLAALVDPEERAAAAAVTNAARTAVRPLAPPIATTLAVTQAYAVPFFVAAGLKSVYDLTLYALFRRVRLPDEERTG